MPEQPSLISVIIVSLNTSGWIRGCLESLQSQDIYDQIEVIVVDNGSTDGSVEMLRSEFPDCRLIAVGENIGFGPANNVGARHASAPVLLFLNADTVVSPGSLSRMLTLLDGRPAWGAAGGLVLDGDGGIERSTGSFPTLGRMVLNVTMKHLPFLIAWFGEQANQHWSGYDRARQVGWVTGAYLWVRNTVFRELDGFDPDIFFYCEDVDLCLRTRALGYQCWFFPEAPVLHFRNKAPTPRSRRRMFRESLHYLGRKHYRLPSYPLTRLFFWVLSKS